MKRKTIELYQEYRPKFNQISNLLIGMNKKSKKNSSTIFSDLYSILENPIIHIQALGNIKANKGAGTPGIDKNTLNKMSLKIINNISQELKNKTFKFSPVRRVYIPKPGSEKKRPLGIPIFKDRIVQESIRIILETIYEPIFERLPHKNYGFRPQKSAHDAINFLRDKGTGSSIAIEGDIIGAYDNVNIPLLIKILRKKINDEQFLKLIKQGCYCGLFEFEQYQDTLTGVPQGGIASPILFNIYMHEFDSYVNYKLQNIIERYNKITKRYPKKKTKLTTADVKLYERNKEYHNINSKIRYNRKILDPLLKNFSKEGIKFNSLPPLTQSKIKLAQGRIFNLIKLRVKTPSINLSKRAIRFIYCRYADDWIILINSTYKFAKIVTNHIKKWLKKELLLDLSPEKTKITPIKNNFARFLGFVLYTYKCTRISRAEDNTLVRTGGYNIKIGIDMERVRKRLIIKHFCNKKFKPIGVRPYSVLSLKEIITKYTAVIRGMANYYIPAIDYIRPFSQIYYILTYSCYGTIATKYNTSIYKLMKNFGKPPKFTLELKIKTKKETLLDKENLPKDTLNPDPSLITTLFLPSYYTVKESAKQLSKRNIKIPDNPFKPLKKINWRTYKNLQGYCVICGSRENIEWHHVNSIKKIGQKVTGFQKVMQSLNRKQLPVCKTHHIEITNGKYNDIRISDLAEIDYWLS